MRILAGESGGLTLVYEQDNVTGELYFDEDYVSITVSGTIEGGKVTSKNDKNLAIDAFFKGDSKLGR